MLRDVLTARKNKLSADHPDIAQTLSGVGRNLLERRIWGEAEPLLREGLTISEAKRPDDWNLGRSLLGQEKCADAEPRLLSGYEWMRSREAKIPAWARSRLAMAGERVVQLYESTGREAEAAKWRSKRKPPGQPEHKP
jgi:hypothetical protein